MASPPPPFFRRLKTQAQVDPTGFVLNVGLTGLVFSSAFAVIAIACAVLSRHC